MIVDVIRLQLVGLFLRIGERMRSVILIYCFASLVCLTPNPYVHAQESAGDFVEWKSTAGTTLDAKLIAEDSANKTVTLQTADGRKVTVPISKLIPESQKTAKALEAVS